MALTHQQMVDLINAGGSVTYKGKLITQVADLPSDAQLQADARGQAYVAIVDGADTAQGATTDTAYADATGAATGTILSVQKGIFLKLAGALSIVRRKGTPTEALVTGAGSNTLAVAGARQSVRATLIAGQAWVSRTSPAPTAAPARLMNAGDALYDDETTAAWYYTAVGGTATFSVEAIA